MQRPPQVALASWTRGIAPSAIQQLLVSASQPGVTSFALGLPAPELFPSAAFGAAMARVLAEDPRALQYGPPTGRLKAQIVELMARRGVSCTPEQVLLTTGAQQGLSLLAHLLVEPGQQVMIERLAYSGFRQVLDLLQPRVLHVPTGLEHGLDIDAAERTLAAGARPALIYTVCDGHNPLGTSLDAAQRLRLVELARAYGVPVIEDDPYGFLRYEPGGPPPLRALDDEWVYYVGSFSKILAPAVRVGWLVVPAPLVPKLEVVKEASDINTASLAQRAVAAYLDSENLDRHLGLLRRTYRERRDTMLEALQTHLAGRARWTRPQSGMFIWLELERPIDTGVLLREAIARERIAFLPGAAFTTEADPAAARSMRLNFSNVPPAQIADGIARLARLIARFEGGAV
ncbi:MAG TPA: PLP-dependent aminotransferase family protein [Roseiflexaceae bacterium]|nr:PLP-dependent aminotransferase family protein [Roseiflexaceae bacterium]